MSSSNANLKPIKLYGHASGANPWKVAMVLKALDIPYETEYVDFSRIKQEPYISVNPNGRVPAIEDPNTGITLWESGAIIKYLVDKYDPSNTFSFPAGSDASYHMDQWIAFQISGQGPYMGQAAWFIRFHHEKLPSAIERYQRENERIVSVINLHLQRTGQKYLVADADHKEGKLSVADIIFVSWGVNAPLLAIDDLYKDGKNKEYKEWIERLTGEKYVADTLEEKKAAAGH